MPARTPTRRQKTAQELMREATNAAAVAVVKSGFDAIDELAEMGKDSLKRLIIRSLGRKNPQS